MQFNGALVRQGHVTFAVVSVKRHVTGNRIEAASTISSFEPVFPGIPVILMSQDASGRATYMGRSDITRFLANVSPTRLPWKLYTIN